MWRCGDHLPTSGTGKKRDATDGGGGGTIELVFLLTLWAERLRCENLGAGLAD